MQDLTGREDGGPVQRRNPRPIAVYLLILAVVALVPAFVFSAILLQRNNEAQEAVVQALTQTTTQALANGVDRQVQGMITTLRVLSSAHTLSSGDLKSFHERATAALLGTGAYLVALDENFNQLINTRVPYGTPLGQTSDPASAQEALNSGKVVVSDVIFSNVANTYVVNVLMPQPGAPPVRLLLLTQDSATLGEALRSRELPEGWNVALLDGEGRVIGATPGAIGFTVGESAPLAINENVRQRGSWRYVTVGDHEMVAVSRMVPETGWTVVAFTPRNLVERPFADAVWALILGGTLLAVLVAAIVWWITKRIAASVQGLAADAKRLGAGQPVKAHDYPIAEIAAVAATLDEASRQRLAHEAEVRFLMRELAHRSKNQMTVIAAMAKQSAKTAESVPEFVADLERRIQGLARSTDLLLAHGASGVDLGELISHQISPFSDLEDGRVTLTGPPLRLNTQAAQILGMAIHELATNAVKHGALAQADGTLSIGWGRRGDRLEVLWREHVRDMPSRPERRGFGTVVLENIVGSALGANVSRTLHADGLECRLEIPLEAIDPAGAPQPTPGAAALERAQRENVI